MKLINSTEYDTRTLHRIIEAVRKNEKFVPPSWNQLVIEVKYAKTPVGLRGRVLSYSVLAGEVRDTRMRLLAHTCSTLGEVAGCQAEDKNAVCSCSCGTQGPCEAWRAHRAASERLNTYFSLHSSSGPIRWANGSRPADVSVPRHSLHTSLFANRIDIILRTDADWDVPARLAWSHLLREALGIGDELFEVQPAPPTQAEKDAARRKKRLAKIASLEKRAKAWETKRKRAETALKKIDRELKRLRTLEAKEQDHGSA